MLVKLLTYTPDAEKIVASAAKLCYSSVGIDEIMENLTEEKVDSFLDMISSIGHQSVIEHCSFTFGIEGISRTLTHQLVRHRLASYSQRSQRYVKEGQFEYIIPPEIEKIPRAKEIFIKSMENDQKDYDELVNILKLNHTEKLLEQFNNKYGDFGSDVEGYSKAIKKMESQAEKMAIEDARFVLPNACETKIMVTMNARTLFNFFHHRCCERAQWEIRAMAWEMLCLVREVAPSLFKYAGPSCVKGICPEGIMSCGNIKKIK